MLRVSKANGTQGENFIDSAKAAIIASDSVNCLCAASRINDAGT